MIARKRRLWLALCLLGAVATLGAAMITIRSPGTPVAPDADAVVPLSRDERIGLTFVTEQARLNGLRLWLEQPAPGGAQLSVTISSAATPSLALIETTLPLDALGPDGALDVRFEPLTIRATPQVLTTTLYVQLAAQGISEGQSVLLRGAVEGDATRSIAFTPWYQTRPFDALWPISSMADGRPGILGWPPLYALVAFGVLWMLTRILWLVLQLEFVGPEAGTGRN